jgi:hypothetical protein
LGNIIQGLCQGNTAAPAGWSLISAVLVKVYKSFGHGAYFQAPISHECYDTAGVLYVDDVDLFTMRSSLVTNELWEEVAASTESWTELLTVPGGWLKSFWKVVDRYHLMLEFNYKDIPIPRENDATITSIGIGHGFGGDDLLSITRCRLSCCSIFLSDITAANSRYLDPTRRQAGFDYRPLTSYTFPREQPSDHDCMVWDILWTQHCYADGSLPRTLGKWLHNTHRLWEWFYHPTEDVIVQRAGSNWWAYRPCLDADAILT